MQPQLRDPPRRSAPPARGAAAPRSSPSPGKANFGYHSLPRNRAERRDAAAAESRGAARSLRQLQRAERGARFLLLLPLPNDFHFTCRQPGCGGAGGSAALRGTAVTAAAPSPPRGGSRAGGAGRAAQPSAAAARPAGGQGEPCAGGACSHWGEGRGGRKEGPLRCHRGPSQAPPRVR